ncbi:MAG: HIRAN domain-containing protein [Methylococcales bacterium]|nr:HIRAN domain-containing protein [Methylococcales bacterium]
MMIILIAFLIIIVLYSLLKKSNALDPSKKIQKFNYEMPNDFTCCAGGLVAGVYFRKNAALKFSNSDNLSIELELEPQNEEDKNAIKVIGVSSSGRSFIGYIPKELAAQIAETKLFESIQPRLTRIYQGKNDYLEIYFDLIIQKSLKPLFKAYIDNQKADASEKEFLKYFNIPIPKGLTKGTAKALKKQHLRILKKENPELLKEYDDYNLIINDLNDVYLREEIGIKKPTQKIIATALLELKSEGKSYEYLSENIDQVANKIIANHPELKRLN